jgi:uncharacterized membrane protein YhhN
VNITIVVLTILTALSEFLCIRARLSGPRLVHYIFKPLTMVFIILIALQKEPSASSFYKYMIVAGLLLSLAGDIFLMLPSDKFVPGVFSFLIAHLFYITAFWTEGTHASSFLYLIPFLLHGAVMLSILLPHLGKMKLPVLVYMLALLLMGWQALNRWAGSDQPGSLSALIGAILFVASDSILAIDRFRKSFDRAHLYILLTYFTAQWFIAFSV